MRQLCGALILLAGAPPCLAGQGHTLILRPYERGLPNVMAARDPAAALDPEASLNPFVYACVAFVEVRAVGGDASLPLLATGDSAWSADRMWVATATDPAARQRPRVMTVLGIEGETAMVTLDLGGAREQYIVGVDSAWVLEGSGRIPVKELATEPFSIPERAREGCGRVPKVDVDLLMPDGEHAGFNVDIDAFWRRPIHILGTGLFELGLQASASSAGESTLLNTLSLHGRWDIKLTKGHKHWVSVGYTQAIEATERFDVVDLAFGATAKIRLDFLSLDKLRPLLRRFTPYPVLNLEYNLVDRIKGAGEPEVAGRPDTEHRFRASFDWEVPMILGTTLRTRLRADYLFSDVPAGESRLRTVNDVTLEYPLGLAEDVALVVQWLEGRAAPTYDLAARWLLGLGLRR